MKLKLYNFGIYFLYFFPLLFLSGCLESRFFEKEGIDSSSIEYGSPSKQYASRSFPERIEQEPIQEENLSPLYAPPKYMPPKPKHVDLLQVKEKKSASSAIHFDAMQNAAPGEQEDVLPTPTIKKQTKSVSPVSASLQEKKRIQEKVVVKGDTLFSIAKEFGVKVSYLKKINHLKKNHLNIGQVLSIPLSKSLPQKDVPDRLAQEKVSSSKAPKKDLAQGKNHKIEEPKKVETSSKVEEKANDSEVLGMRWPARGRIIGTYKKGAGNSSDGIDIQVPIGTAIHAAQDGVVIYAGDGLKSFGHTILIRHKNGLVTVYGHASEINVERGQTVKRGQKIGLSGMSGTTESPRLHFEIRKNAVPVDPAHYLK